MPRSQLRQRLQLLTFSDAARLLRISVADVAKAVSLGQIEALILDPQQQVVRIARIEVEQYRRRRLCSCSNGETVR